MDRAANLTEVLACPRCKGRLTAGPDEASLNCIACRLRYQIDDGIPVLMVSRATPLDPSEQPTIPG
ncbi:MAG: Trm112 family protein [Candidatus Dormibacteraeota bacterium]|nr:Trm112 family protein [Candidatus Dormibacteraeota bacterium]